MRALTALLVGVALLLMGSGLLGTLLAVRGGLEGFGDQTLGLIMSGYFVGFFLGTYLAPGLIQRIGHIRAFAPLRNIDAWYDAFGVTEQDALWVAPEDRVRIW